MVAQTEPTTRAAQAAEAAAMRRWERMRAGGRSAFVWRNGVVGWGLPAAIVTGAYKILEVQGFAWPPALPPALRQALILIAVIFPALGYVFGGWLWTQGEARYLRAHPDRAQAGESDATAREER